jgi:ABC-2 type transport system permease protein
VRGASETKTSDGQGAFMSINVNRVLGLIKKEFIQFFRDKVVVGLILYHFVVCIVLCGYSFLFLSENIRLVVYDMSRTEQSRELIDRFQHTEAFTLYGYVTDMGEVRHLLNSGRARAALIIPAEFSRELVKGRRADVQFIADASDANQAGQSVGYASKIVAAFNRDATLTQLNRDGTPVEFLPGVSDAVRPVYNQGLKEVGFVVVSHILVAGVIGGLMLSSTAIVREKERGTIDQLLVTPTRSIELLLAKTIAPLMICLIATFFSFLIVAWFNVKLSGSVFVFFTFMTLFLTSMIGIGALIGCLCNNTLQAILLSFVVWFPAVFLCGVATPVENMLPFMQVIANVFPTTPFMDASNAIFTKGQGFLDLWREAFRLILTGGILLSLGAWVTWKQWKQ